MFSSPFGAMVCLIVDEADIMIHFEIARLNVMGYILCLQKNAALHDISDCKAANFEG